MGLNVEKELAALRKMTVGQLRERYAEVYGEPTNARHKTWLIKRIIWRLQALEEGDLSERARRRAEELARDADLRTTAPAVLAVPSRKLNGSCAKKTQLAGDRRLPLPGTIITREYKDASYEIQVLTGGFEFEGQRYKSLSAVAKKITGSHLNGYQFFRLGKHGGS